MRFSRNAKNGQDLVLEMLYCHLTTDLANNREKERYYNDMAPSLDGRSKLLDAYNVNIKDFPEDLSRSCSNMLIPARTAAFEIIETVLDAAVTKEKSCMGSTSQLPPITVRSSSCSLRSEICSAVTYQATPLPISSSLLRLLDSNGDITTNQSTIFVDSLLIFVCDLARKGTIFSCHKEYIPKNQQKNVFSLRLRCKRFEKKLDKCQVAFNCKLRTDGRGWDVITGKMKQYSHEKDFSEEDVGNEQNWLKNSIPIADRVKEVANKMLNETSCTYANVLQKARDEIDHLRRPMMFFEDPIEKDELLNGTQSIFDVP